MKSNEAKVSIWDREAFVELKNDFDEITKRVLVGMTQKESAVAEITMKLKITLVKSCIKSFQPGYTDEVCDVKEAYKPSFEHKFTSVIQIKDSIEGEMENEVALVWDEYAGEFVLQLLLEDEQLSLDSIGTEYVNTKKAIEQRKSGYTYTEKDGVIEEIKFQQNKTKTRG